MPVEVETVTAEMEAMAVWNQPRAPEADACVETTAAATTPGDGGGAAGTMERRVVEDLRSGADDKVAWWSGRRWGCDNDGARGRETGESRRDPRGGAQPPREKPWIGSDGPLEMGSQTTTNLARGQNCRGGFLPVETSGICGSQMSPK
jgi:hypothetical protein